MRISRLRLHNFKSFQNADVSLGPFNVVIGPNASGKSNLVQAFRFIRDVSMNGLENAVSLQGGSEFLPNLSTDGSDTQVSMAVECNYESQSFSPTLLFTPNNYLANNISCKYALDLEFNVADYGYRIVREELQHAFKLFELPDGFGDHQDDDPEAEGGPFGSPIGEGEITIALEDGVVRITDEQFSPKTGPRALEISPNVRSFLESERRLSPNVSLLETQHSRLVGVYDLMMWGMSIYDFDPRLPKRGSPITGRADLEEDGSNLAIVLNEITRDKEKSRKFHNLIGDLLPFVERMSVDRFADNSLLLNLRETYVPDRDIPASLLSDGTIGITAIIIALAFENNQMNILEEPDKNVHPHLISRLNALMKDMQSNSQILLTTHNPEFVRHADIEDLILVHRDEKGFSQISRPAESEIVKAFMDEEMGVHDLYVDDFLVAG